MCTQVIGRGCASEVFSLVRASSKVKLLPIICNVLYLVPHGISPIRTTGDQSAVLGMEGYVIHLNEK